MTGLGNLQSDVELAKLQRGSGKSCFASPRRVGEAVQVSEPLLLEQLRDGVMVFVQSVNVRSGVEWSIRERAGAGGGLRWLIIRSRSGAVE
jgi:hypothetical protein